MSEQSSFQWVKQQYFSNSDKCISLKKGEELLNYGQQNKRLFLVLKGKFHGFLKEANLENYPIFEATPDKFIGVYSYFSTENLSYSRVVAMEDAEVAYYDKALLDHGEKELVKLMPFLMSVVVNELYERQHFAKRMAREKQEDVQKLLKAEKMATLGQMAAGLAHELNNSIGVLNSNLEQLESFISACVQEHHGPDLIKVFNQSLQKGQMLSSAEARAERKRYEKAFPNLSPHQVRKLSKTGIDPDQIKNWVSKNPALMDKVYKSWEVGNTLHDMKIAAKHSSHVVRSVKQLGVAEHQWSKEVQVNETIKEALAITNNLVKRVETEINLGNLDHTEACAGELVQVWINLIKNAVESMIHGKTDAPKLIITSSQEADHIKVSISDSGPGIPEDIRSKIFQPSFTTKVGGLSFGLGLGLSIVQRIVTEHDGQISVSSTPGETVFLISIPLQQNHG